MRQSFKYRLFCIFTAVLIGAVVASAGANAYATDSLNTAGFTNWSGYAASGETFDKVTGEFYVRKTACPAPNAAELTWVGLDGLAQNVVEQAGLWVHCSGGANPKPIYDAFWEMAPDTAKAMPMSVHVGDELSVTVSYSSATKLYSMAVKDLQSGKHYAKQTKCAAGVSCKRNSAEWIVERPDVNYSPARLADWGDMGFYGAEAAAESTDEPIAAYNHTRINLVNLTGSKVIAKVGKLTPDGKSFRATWLASK
jgi:hypothetical protein